MNDVISRQPQDRLLSKPAGCSWSPSGLRLYSRPDGRLSGQLHLRQIVVLVQGTAGLYFSSFRNLTSIPFRHLVLTHLPTFPCFHGLRRDWFLSALLVPLITYLNPTLPRPQPSVSPSLVISGLVAQTESRVSLQSSFPLSPFT